MQTAEQITEESMFQAGREHALSNKTLTPYDCREITDLLFTEKNKLPTVMERIKYFNKMRGAFNAGWNQAYFEMVSKEGAEK